MTLAALAVLAYTGVVVDAGFHAPSVSPLIGSLGAVGLLMLGFALWRADDELLPWALLLAGLGYGLSLAVSHAGVAEGVPLIGGGLLLCGELATWSLDERFAIRADRAIVSAVISFAGASNQGGFEIDAGGTTATDALYSGNQAGDDWTKGTSGAGVFKAGGTGTASRRTARRPPRRGAAPS